MDCTYCGEDHPDCTPPVTECEECQGTHTVKGRYMGVEGRRVAYEPAPCAHCCPDESRSYWERG